MKWIVQAAPQDASNFNWDALAAIGTTFAAVTALVIWIVDMRRRRRDRTSAAKLLAVRLISDVEQLSRVFASSLSEMNGGHRSPTAEDQMDFMQGYTKSLSLNYVAARSLVQAQMDAVDLERFERLADQVGIMPARVSDSLAELLRRSISLQNAAKRVGSDPTPARVEGGLVSYFCEMVQTHECTKQCLLMLYSVSGLLQTDVHETPAARH
ncbi:hypothetical protein [Stenotrophomonas sp. SY1]|uniref:hypothetical protein n=1 Tax=Stenotrophomonas sp. SY1 TaxID=477235 RepID=UPI001E42FF23|nr:hypothetical protein [Stenotrophomonas sp. SY1]MCD9087382.1 hypothetical protein [Stenotrophomonas sp. SY1]